MEIIQKIILMVIGVAGGVAVAGGTFALITILGIIPRFADRFGLSKYIYKMETTIALGGTIGSLLTVFKLHIPIGNIGMGIFGIFAGIFIGSLAMSLAENLKVIPIAYDRMKLKTGLQSVVAAIALGKGLAAFYQLFIRG